MLILPLTFFNQQHGEWSIGICGVSSGTSLWTQGSGSGIVGLPQVASCRQPRSGGSGPVRWKGVMASAVRDILEYVRRGTAPENNAAKIRKLTGRV